MWLITVTVTTIIQMKIFVIFYGNVWRLSQRSQHSFPCWYLNTVIRTFLTAVLAYPQGSSPPDIQNPEGRNKKGTGTRAETKVRVQKGQEDWGKMEESGSQMTQWIIDKGMFFAVFSFEDHLSILFDTLLAHKQSKIQTIKLTVIAFFFLWKEIVFSLLKAPDKTFSQYCLQSWQYIWIKNLSLFAVIWILWQDSNDLEKNCRYRLWTLVGGIGRFENKVLNLQEYSHIFIRIKS